MRFIHSLLEMDLPYSKFPQKSREWHPGVHLVSFHAIQILRERLIFHNIEPKSVKHSSYHDETLEHNILPDCSQTRGFRHIRREATGQLRVNYFAQPKKPKRRMFFNH